MNTPESLIIVAVAALIHASFQLSVSVLTLLSSHTIGAKRSHARLLGLTNAFALGVTIMTVLLLSTTALLIKLKSSFIDQTALWVVACGLLFGLGVAVWIFYYRRGQGTSLWLPRGLARYLSDRTKATKQSAEAFGLGLSSVVAELLFVFVPILVSALVLIELSPAWQLAGIGLYTALSLAPLLAINAMIGSGHKISRIQRWREDNKRFLQFASGGGLLVLGFYVYVDQVLTPTVLAAANGGL
ncbi:MAG TPA: hypothetical protein PK096_00535 [Candidatus Saccharibacteria bacterium]|nr:hypothetical protein [Candidatus Saccharibacteria bacterium]HRK93841.1 hypothetical protein [Candidatus Saccharibacteria bacterium]